MGWLDSSVVRGQYGGGWIAKQLEHCMGWLDSSVVRALYGLAG